jgi:hypothetical protein
MAVTAAGTPAPHSFVRIGVRSTPAGRVRLIVAMGGGELNLQDTAGSVVPLSTQVAVPVGSSQIL